jgi:inorganic phosphate transporter, PiT family
MGIFFFLSSGLFLGWSLGANHAANVFGTAVGSRMVRFETAAVICAVFVILGATISGAGAAHTLGRLGSVNALAGAFTVSLSAALSVALMTRLGLPVSTSEAMVGGILGWNFYTASATDPGSLGRIVGSWVVCPVLAALLAALLFLGVRAWHRRTAMHMLAMDSLTRWGLLVVGAFGAYSLGANNIANVMGVFLPDNPFHDLTVAGVVRVTGAQQLFFLGAAAIGVGVFTYSRRVIDTVGGGIMRFSPLAALVVVLAHSLVLFLFSSESLQRALTGLGLPSFPLVPVSSSQAVVGAILGIGLVRGGRGLRWRSLGGIAVGWAATPALACVLTFISLFFVENVFRQEVVHRGPAVVQHAVVAPRAPGLVARTGTGIDTR